MNVGQDDATLDTPISSDPDAGAACERPRVQLIGATSEPFYGETTDLIRRRLHAASVILSAAIGVFMAWRLIGMSVGVRGLIAESGLVGQMLVLSVLIACTITLRKKRPVEVRFLQVKELMVFGAPAMLILITQFTMMRLCAQHDNMLPHIETPWMLLIFVYAMFIPNSWRRAAWAIGLLAGAPILLTAYLWFTDQLCAQLLREDLWFVTMSGTAMLISGGAALAGVYTINSLRQEAQEARQLGQYRLKRLLGSGGMGEVYLAEHLLMKRPCAIKLIRPDRTGDRRTLARFEREVHATAKLSHWNTIDIYDYGRAADGTFYYVMEYLPGLSLDDLVKQYGPLPAGRVIFLLAQTCEALAEAHAVGLVHRDIKPANIFVAQRGGRNDVTKLLDFGMVKPRDTLDSTALTQDGSITGSPLYMSPEQVLGESEPDARSDIYSLGVVAYYALAGRPPFDARQPIQVLFAHANKPPLPLRAIARDVPADLEAVVMKCLAKTPAERFQSAVELETALRACADADHWSFAKAAGWWRSRGDEG